MKTYIFRTNEISFLSSFQNEFILIPKLKDFQINDKIIFLISDKFAGMCSIRKTEEKNKKITLYLSHEYAFLEENRFSIYDKNLLPIFKDIGNDSISCISKSKTLFKILENTLDDYTFFLTNIDDLYEKAKELHTIQQKKEIKKEQDKFNQKFIYATADEHQKAQYLLNEIGTICNVETWTATNDKTRMYRGRTLGEFDTEEFPQLLTNEHSHKRIELIDSIWIRENRPVSAFEVETTTSIYSGLLRLGDMAALLSTSQLQLYIVAPERRAKKFINELQRPLFQQAKLDKICRFIPLESLEILYQKITGLDGFVDYQAISTISFSVEQLEQLHT